MARSLLVAIIASVLGSGMVNADGAPIAAVDADARSSSPRVPPPFAEEACAAEAPVLPIQLPSGSSCPAVPPPGQEIRFPARNAGAGTPPASSASADDWSIVASPNASGTFPRSVMNGVTCVSATDCWAVGYTYTGTAFQTLTEHWNGSEWAVVASPNSSELELNVLYDVECLSSTSCWAVGYSSTGTAARSLIERWDGTSWTIVPSSSVSTLDFLWDVDCLSPSSCWAAGYTYSGPTGAAQTLLHHWDGSTWAIVASANTGNDRGNSLAAVSCTSASSCWAVGGAAGATLIERWDGASWSIVPSPNNTAYEANSLSGVTCVSPVDCWAVGVSQTDNEWRTLVQRWDGTAWTIVPSPNKTLQMNYLGDITCLSATDCWSVGAYAPGSAWRTMIQRWDGSSWMVVASPSTDDAENDFLNALTCLSADDCWTVGSAWSTKAIRTVVERWHPVRDGEEPSWNIVASPNTLPINTNILSSVDCTSANDCWAVGHYAEEPFGLPRTLTEHWDGSAWSVVPSPNAGTQNVLSDVACVSSSDCWAVGYYYGGGGARTLALHWDGNAWQKVASANQALDSFLFSVTCVSATDCWAVGNHYAGSPSMTLATHWDGSSWTVVPSPNPSSRTPSARQRNLLSDVACVSSSQCWAVGSYDADSPVNPDDVVRAKTSRTLTLNWNGTSWTTVPSPDTAAVEQHSLSKITCVAASDCWAVGQSFNSIHAQTFVGAQEVARTSRQTLIKRWNGTSWATVASANSSTSEDNVLSGVGCRAASDCWAVGSVNDGTRTQTLIQKWDGNGWAAVTSPNASVRDSLLSDIACAGPDCWAVGNSHNSVVPHTLVARSTSSL